MSEKNQIDEQKELEARQAVTEQWLRDGGLVYVLRNGANYYEVVVTMVAGSRRPEERAKFAERIRNMLAKAQQPDSDKNLERIGAVFQIGEKALTLGTVLANVENAKRRADCLSAIEREFFTVIKCDEDGEYEESVLSWGVSPDVYVEQFREALALLSAPAAQRPSCAAFHKPTIDAVLDALHTRLEYPTEACAVVRSLLRPAAQGAETALNAERWEFARQYLSVYDIESFAAMKKAGHKPDTVESKKADAAIDAAMQAQRKEGA